MAYFVFAEFGNEYVLDFLRRLRAALSGDVVASPIHVTLRGPYDDPPTPEELDSLAALLPGYGVKIHKHGRFITSKGFAVFLRAECVVFRQMWDKPDFKVSLARIEPHITVFESSDREAARRVDRFLENENLLIHTYDLYLRVYESKPRQADLFDKPLPISTPKGKAISRDLWRLPDGIIDRARALGASLRKPTGDA